VGTRESIPSPVRRSGFRRGFAHSIVFLIVNQDHFCLVFLLLTHFIYGWELLERKFHEHFYSGTSEAKLADLTSVRQTRDESILDYFKRFKEIKNWCFNLTISEKDLADLAFSRNVFIS
jgi:hypothetical protein